MSAQIFRKQYLFLGLAAVLATATFISFTASSPEAVVGDKSSDVSAERTVPVIATQSLPSEAVTVAPDDHPADCSHCNAANTDEEVILQSPATRPDLDYIFKGIAKQEDVTAPRSAFDLKGRQKGQYVSLSIADLELSGTVTAVLEDPNASAYVIKLENNIGRLVVDVDGNDTFSGHVLFFGDSRALTIRDHPDQSDTPKLIVEETTINNLYCAPRGTIYTESGLRPTKKAGLKDQLTKTYAPFEGIAEAIPLDSLPGAEFVMYLDFDGEEVTDPRWLLFTGGDVIDAQPHPRAGDDDFDLFVTSVWRRVSEDFAPFDITVTTDVTVYDAAASDKRLHVVITETDDAYPGTGGVALLDSFRTSSPIVWVFWLSEYECATTISHEAGHAFGLSHDGQPSVEYYPGHNGSYAPGWGAIMGAPFSGGFYDEVDQWSKGEYDGANNQEDDLAIIANTSNGFGYKADDYPDQIGGGFGILNTIGEDVLGATGLISQSSDVDIFRFVSSDGDITLTVSPLDVDSSESQPGSNTQGANLAVQANLLDSNGLLIAAGTADGPVLLDSTLTANLSTGIYYISVEGAGRGADPATGFSDYASLGEYSIELALPLPPLNVTGGEGDYKHENPIVQGDVNTQVSNGTDFGISWVANGPVEHAFYLDNTGTNPITNVSVELVSGEHFYITNPPNASIDGNSTDYTLRIAYDPNSRGLHTDTVIVKYEAGESEEFRFAISGTSTISGSKDNYWKNELRTDTDGGTAPANLKQVQNTWLSDYMGLAFFKSMDRDWFSIDAHADGLTTTDKLITVEVAYDSSEGPVLFELRNYFGTSLGSTTSEDGIIQFRLPGDYNANKSRLYILVKSTNGSSVNTTYDLRWSSTALIEGDDDLYEENNSPETAFDLTGAFKPSLSEYLGEGISNDEDWYKIDITTLDPFTRMLYIRADFVHAEGNIDIEVLDENGRAILDVFGRAITSPSETLNDYEVITFHQPVSMDDFDENFQIRNPSVMGVEPGTYYVRVYGDFAGNSYDLVVETRTDDRYEVVDQDDQGNDIENDRREDAFDLGGTIIDNWLSEVDGIGTCAAYPEVATQENFSFASDADWFEFSANSDTGISEITIEYESYDGGNMVFEIFDSEGFSILISTVTGNEVINGVTVDVTTASSSGVLSMSEPSDSTYFIKVTPFVASGGVDRTGALSGYDFRVTLTAELPKIDGAVEDNYEENDNFQELFDLRDYAGLWLASVDGLGTQFDPDWYEISVPEGAEQLLLYLTSNSSVGNVDLTLRKKAGHKVFESLNGGDLETIIWNDPIPGAYTVTVTGDRLGNSYNLFWDVVLEDDSYEENDEPLSATDLSNSDRSWLRKVGGYGIQKDEDWYKINVPSNTALLDIRTNFNPDAGDIDLELYNANGYLIARSISNDAIESLTYSSPASGDYYIQIHYGNTGNEYDLWWAAFTQEELDSVVEDAYEENDTFTTAYVLNNDQVWLSDLLDPATQTDDDWFVITLAEGNIGLDVDLTFTHADGDIDVEVYDALGSVITLSESYTDNESINYNAPLPDGNYLIRVYGANVGNAYDLCWVDRNRDVFESNNTRQTAYNLGNYKQSYISRIGVPTQGDADWYQIETLVDNSTIVVDLIYSHANGDINLELYDGSGALITDSMTTEDFEYIQQLVPTAGIYYLRVWGDNNHTDYDIFWNAQLEDAFEENDSFLPPVDIPNGEAAGLNAVAFDDDWFAITAPLGAVSVQVDLAFTHGAGDLDLEAYDNNGNLTDTSASADDNETLVIPVNPFGLPFYVRVFHPDRDYGNTYSLTWMSSTTDAYEGNNSIENAFDLTATQGDFLSNGIGFATSKDEDWYSIDVTGSNFAVNCLFSHAAGNIDIELYDVNGVPFARSISESDGEFILQEAITSGTYYLRVYGDLAGNAYDLIWNTYEAGADDLFEDNDSSLAAADLTASGEDTEYQILSDLVQLDEDWFQVEVENPDDRLIIECDFSGSGCILELWLNGPAPLSTAVIDGDLARIDLLNLTAGPYFARVTGPNVGSNYSLRWSSGSDDNYEDNDTLADAYDYSRDAGVLLSGLSGPAYQYNEDWYRVEVATNGNTLIADLSSIVSEGVLSLKILDPFGNELAASSSGGDMTIFLNEQSAGTYFIQVSGPEMGAEYDLLWNDITDDNYEDNDTLADAYDLGSISGALSSIDGPGTRIDDDYYRIDSYKDAVRIQVDCSFTHADGDIALSILDQDGDSVGTVDSSDDGETLTVIILPDAATYYILVDGAQNSGASYDLSWSIDGIDSYEVNDTLVDAYDLSAEEGALLSDVNGFGTQGDRDWYLVSLPNNPTDSAGNPVGPAEILNVELTYTQANGDINLEVRDSLGVNILASSNLLTGTESVSVSVADGNDYYIVVTGDNAGNSYDLAWSLTRDDNYEENDSSANAEDFSAISLNSDGDLEADLLGIDGLGVQLDDDWYAIMTPPGSVVLEVTLFNFLNAEGDVNLEALDSTLTSIVISDGNSDSETARFATDPLGGTYYFRVYGDDAGNTYDLTWSSTTVDEYEPNDSVKDATNLFFDSGIWLDQVDGYATQFQDDWYAIVVSDTSSNLNIQCQFTHASGDIDLELYQLVASPTVERDDPSADERKPVLLTRVTSTDDNELINFAVSEAGVYFIRVYFGNNGNAYNLLWDDGVDDAVGDTTYINDYLYGTWVYAPRYSLVSALLDTPSANVDGDGLANWEEYALGLDPSVQDYVVVGQSITEIAGKNYFQFEFLRRKEAVVLGYEFIVEESSNMAFNGATAVFVGAENVDSEIERVFYRGSLPMDEQSQCFFRLVVNEPIAK